VEVVADNGRNGLEEGESDNDNDNDEDNENESDDDNGDEEDEERESDSGNSDEEDEGGSTYNKGNEAAGDLFDQFDFQHIAQPLTQPPLARPLTQSPLARPPTTRSARQQSSTITKTPRITVAAEVTGAQKRARKETQSTSTATPQRKEVPKPVRSKKNPRR
jgi:hypothetical protein